MAPKKSTSKSSSKGSAAASTSTSSSSSSSRKSSRKTVIAEHADEEEDGKGRRTAPRHSRAPLPASAGSIQRPSTEARFEDLFPDSDAPAEAPAPVASTSTSSSSKRKAPVSTSTAAEGSSSKRKRTDSTARDEPAAQTGRASTSKSKSSSSRAPRATLNEEEVDDFVFTRVDPPAATSSRADTSTKRNGASSSSRKSNHAAGSTSVSASTTHPLLADVADGETPVIRRNKAFRTGAAPATPGNNTTEKSVSRADASASRSKRSKRSEAGSSLRQTLGIGQPSTSQQANASTSRRSSLTTKSSRRRSSLRDGRTPAYPHRDVPATELYRHVNAQAGPLPRLKAIFGWILERGVEDGAKGTLEPTTVPPLPDPVPIPPSDEKKGKKKGKASAANLAPARPPPQPVLNDADRADLTSMTSSATLFRAVLSATLSKTVADLTSPASPIADVNWITRPQAGRASSSAAGVQEGKAKHPRNIAHAAMIARLEGTVASLRSELKRWEAMHQSVEAMEEENIELEAKLETLRLTDVGPDAVGSEGPEKGKAPAFGAIPVDSLLAGQEEAWIKSELDEAQREKYLLALSVLGGRGEAGPSNGPGTPSKSKARPSGKSPQKRKGKRKRGEDEMEVDDDDDEGDGDVSAQLRDAIAEAEWQIDQLRSSTHTLTQLDAITDRYMQAVSLRLGDALKEVTSDAPMAGMAAATDVSGSTTPASSLVSVLRGTRSTNAAASAGTLVRPGQVGAAPGEDPGQDLLRSFITASGGEAGSSSSGRRSAAPPTPRKSAGAGTAAATASSASAEASTRNARRSTNAAASAARPSSGGNAAGAAGEKPSAATPASASAPVPPPSPKPSRLPRPASLAAPKASTSASAATSTPASPARRATTAASNPGSPSRPQSRATDATGTSTKKAASSSASAPTAASPRRSGRGSGGASGTAGPSSSSSRPASPSKSSTAHPAAAGYAARKSGRQ
ncbi:hypothetical protein OC834_001694 [Tilletia horrida]|nr:hypothetical protein OC834_001694 [Tilletia horrida]